MSDEDHRPLQAGDVIGDGYDRRVIVAIYSAGECLEAKADLIALAQRREKTTVDQRSE